MRTRKIETHLPAESVKAIMQHVGEPQHLAESYLLQMSLECYLDDATGKEVVIKKFTRTDGSKGSILGTMPVDEVKDIEDVIVLEKAITNLTFKS